MEQERLRVAGHSPLPFESDSCSDLRMPPPAALSSQPAWQTTGSFVGEMVRILTEYCTIMKDFRTADGVVVVWRTPQVWPQMHSLQNDC